MLKINLFGNSCYAHGIVNTILRLFERKLFVKLLPIGIQDFEKVASGNYCYVDKTKIIYDLISTGSYYFIARPRRFGKSLLLSTIKCIFEGKKELFENLWISKNTSYLWRKHPIIHLSFMTIDYATPERLEKSLILKLKKLAHDAGISCPEDVSLVSLFEHFVQSLAQKEKVVLLIDEYDKPIIDHIHTPEIADNMRNQLRTFYGVIKDLDPYLKFVFITGVSKFSQTSIFSGLNNLHDLTMEKSAATLFGCTKQELELTFAEPLNAMAHHLDITYQQLLDQITLWYNGYCFDIEAERVYNLFSLINAFANKRFNNYWIRTGTPTFLIQLFKKGNYIPQIDPDYQISASNLEIVDFARIPFIPLLYQTGYLTLLEQTEQNKYRLCFPNKEVSESFTEIIAAGVFEKDPSEINSLAAPLRRMLERLEIDDFFEQIKLFYADIPYTVAVPNREKHYQTIFYVLTKIIGLNAFVEIATNRGRIDFVLELKQQLFIFEFKIKGSAQDALEQIKSTQYDQKYHELGKSIILVGVLFSIQNRNIDSWVYEVIKS